ncbi:reverse transcriptase [Plakobranchus ocellatus]|uniref:Reverse transcriptase n=1 Tax=Plakobranchus ocellatus TaxID=259542 RepID=A0AAV4AK41_9GAST|nr:reverse transcriptase [Plakobranchus ocellatus]
MESSSITAAPFLSDALFKTLIDSFFTPLVVCITTLGIVGNVINIMIFRKRAPMDVMTTCFIALAVSDLLYFCFCVPDFIVAAFIKNSMRILYNVDIHSLVLFTMLYQKSLFNKISITITAFMSFERSLCVVKPFLVKTLFPTHRVAIILTAIYLCLIALFIPALLSAEAVWQYLGNRTEPVLMFQRTSLRAVADHIRSLMTGFSLTMVTQMIITISAGLMISGLRRHQHFRQTASSGTRRPGKPDRTRHKLTLLTLKTRLGKETSRGTLQNISENAKNETEPSCADEQSERKPSEKVALPLITTQGVVSVTNSTENSSSQTKNPAERASSKELQKEVIAHTQTDRRGLGSTTAKWWSKPEGKEKRDIIIDEIRNKEDSTRVQKAVQQPQHGQWTNWDTAIQRSFAWNDIWHMVPLRISFLIRSVYDLLPSNANLVRWGKNDDPTCPLYRACTELVQSNALTRAIHVRNNRILQELASVISTAKGDIHPSSTSSTVFTKDGRVKKWHGGSITIDTHRKGLLDGCDDWVVSADLPEWERHPDVIRKTALRPDIVIHSASTQQIIMVELTVPYENKMEEAHAFKEGKYLDLTKELKKDGYKAKVMPVEIGARGFVTYSAFGLLSKLSIGGNKRTKALRLLAETAENSSRWIWSRRNERLLHKE